ncbi:hypothetical protein D3C78_1448270 [compost metagenome]
MPGQVGRGRVHEAHTARLPLRPQRQAQRVIERAQRQLHRLAPGVDLRQKHLLDDGHARGLVDLRAQALVVQVQVARERVQRLAQRGFIAGQ